jgi:hypothetical protein
MSVLNEYLSKTKPELRELVRDLDALISKAAPDLVPSLKWGNLTYHHDRNVCSLIAHKTHVNLQVWGGASLDDPEGLLVGSGKSMRHVEVALGRTFSRRAVSAIVRAADRASRA